MAAMPKNFVDLVITSPPYDSLREYGGFYFDYKKTISSLFQVLKPGGVAVWIVGDQTVNGSETGSSFRQAIYAMESGFLLHDTMIYFKDNPPPVGGANRYYQSFEYMFVFSKGKPKTFNPILEERRNKWNDKRKVRFRPVTRNKSGAFTSKEVTVNDFVKLQNVWCYTVSGGSVAEEMIAHQHPAIFPEALVRDHVVTWSNEGELVYDPFSGSGTVAKCCLANRRNFIGSEVSKEYCELAELRLEEYRNNLTNQRKDGRAA